MAPNKALGGATFTQVILLNQLVVSPNQICINRAFGLEEVAGERQTRKPTFALHLFSLFCSTTSNCQRNPSKSNPFWGNKSTTTQTTLVNTIKSLMMVHATPQNKQKAAHKTPKKKTCTQFHSTQQQQTR